jgi:large subunit ribosomal protein L21
LMIIDGDDVKVGNPAVSGVKVTADVVSADTQADKVTSIRYKAKKRVHKVRGHRQHQTTIKIAKIG